MHTDAWRAISTAPIQILKRLLDGGYFDFDAFDLLTKAPHYKSDILHNTLKQVLSTSVLLHKKITPKQQINVMQ